MEKKSSPIIIISVLTGILLLLLVGMLVFFNLPTQRLRRMLKSAHKYIAEENYDEAILTLQKMLEIDPKNEDLYVMLADTYEKNGDIDKEVEFLQKAVTLMPENQKISEVLTDVYPEVTISEAEGTFNNPISLTLDAPEESKIYYTISGTGLDDKDSDNDSDASINENEYSEPITLEKNGKYNIEYYAVSKNGYEGEHKNGTYVIELDESKYHFNEWVDESQEQILVGQWKQDAKGRWWDNGDGTYPVSTWQWIDENNDHVAECYYFDQDGYLLTSTTTPDGRAVNADGQWVEREIPDDEIREFDGFYTDKYDSRYMVKVFIPDDSPLIVEPGIYKSTFNVTYVDCVGPNYIETDYYDHNFKIIDDGGRLKFMLDFDDHGWYWYAGTLIDRNDGYYETADLDGCDGAIYGIYVISDDVIIVETGDGGDGDYHGFFTMKKVS